MKEENIDNLCIALFDRGLKSVIDLNSKQKTLYLFLDIFYYIEEDGLDVYLSNNLNPPFDIIPNINAMRELGLDSISDHFQFIKVSFDNNEFWQEVETWEGYKTRIGILDRVNYLHPILSKIMVENFPLIWIIENYNELIDNLDLRMASRRQCVYASFSLV
jgi:hypothetical protein